MKRKLLTLVWLLAILFPVSWVGTFWPAYRAAFEAVFKPEWVHIIAHLVLFTGLGALLATVFPEVARRPLLAAALLLLAGVLQESFQALSTGNELSKAVFDLGIDLLSGLAGLWAARALMERRRRSSARTAHPGP